MINDLKIEDDIMLGWIPSDAIWFGRKELRVAFVNTIPSHWHYRGSRITHGEILRIANMWSFLSNNIIPRFVKAEYCHMSDIRLEFNCKFMMCTVGDLKTVMFPSCPVPFKPKRVAVPHK